MLMKVLILGAGNIGRQIAKYLGQYPDYDVTVGDKNPQTLEHAFDSVADYRIKTVVIEEQFANAINGVDVVVNASPHTENIVIARAAAKFGCHYFDLSEDVESTEFIKGLAIKNKNLAFMPQCGLAPGYINIVANDLLKRFDLENGDSIHDVKMRVGALPLAPSNALKYNFTWSVDGLINEYINDGKAIENGKIAVTKGMEGLEHITIDGIEYEAFNTSGGAGSMIESLTGIAKNVNYKTLRYPGHRDLMNVLLEDLKLKYDRETLKKILVNAIPSTDQDVIVTYISVTGIKNGKLVEFTTEKKHYAETGSTAIQKTTAGGLCIALDLFKEGSLPQCGFLRQEDIDLNDFYHNRFSIGTY
jgi:saccharopine dehydrogenase-like NADP-dependent oxidoreductase